MSAELPTLTDQQRQAIRDFFDTNPDGGYKSACHAAGIHRLPKALCKQLIDGDDELAEHRERRLGVDEDSAWRRVATIAADLGHKDALRANTFILGAIHGRSEQQRLQLAGDPENPIEVTHDVAAGAERFIALTDAAVREAARQRTTQAASDTLGPGES